MVVIAGDQGHAEVGSYLGHAGGNGVVISTIEDAREFVEGSRITEDKICIVAQTTFDREMFNVIVNQFRAKGSKPRVFNTICSATVKRQKEAMLISRLADVMIVVGGKNSANTGRLAQICRNSGKKTYYIERPEELDPEVLKDCHIIGITAGASTSKSTIESVTGYIDEKINQSKEE